MRKRRLLSIVLTLCMVLMLVPTTTFAENETSSTPSVSAYATKAQLMDNTFAPNLSGNATNIGKLVFGKNSESNSQEWYILGKDEGVTGDNTIIFAASPIAINQEFEDEFSDNKTFQSSFGVYASNPTEVYPNHYGASDLRVVLQSMATNTSYFTKAERGLMNATTVTTKDTNNSTNYTTTDKLYALQGDHNNNQYLWAGTGDSTVLAMNSYCSDEYWFWLRSPYDYSDYGALLASPGDDNGDYVRSYDVDWVEQVQPASNLNLSSVLFASAAKASSSGTAESGTIAEGTAMTLRFNGTGKNIGRVTYSTTTGDIKAVKGTTSQTVALVVQGRGTVRREEKDWYYSKQIGTSETINASAIKSALGLSSDIDLSDCKIWLEITDTDGLIYAVGAEKAIEKINTTYVTKEQLMNSFKPYSDGNAANYGKMVFGKNSSGTAQEWYILGKDDRVSGDNTIIFAASPIATGQMFENDYSNNKTFQSSFGVYASNPTDVFPNHYGASDLRVALQGMATNTNYFTTAEQGLMNATTVTTKDTNNSSVTYTTTDKLYALAADGNGSSYTTIKAGSDNSTVVLAMSSYWSNGSEFWLRPPYDGLSGTALLAFPGRSVYGSGVKNENAVQPASNLNLSSVLFASVATAASSETEVADTITSGTAMTLRLNGTGKNIGTVTYNTTTGDIKAANGSTSQTVVLVVQGKDGTNDWYYSKQIDTSETVNASAIKSALGLSSDIDLSDCNIWLEITDTDGLIYAVNATKTTIADISSVEIIGIEAPAVNTALSATASCATEGVSSTTPQITWTPSDTTAGYNTSYTASITLTADTGYEFADNVAATVNGKTATSVNKNEDGTLTVTYTFPEIPDTVAPVISGVEDGKTYCSAQTVTVSDNDAIATVTVNGIEVTLDEHNQFTLSPADGEQKIIATDKAGNKKEVTVTVNNGHTYGAWQSNGKNTHRHYCTVEGCKSYEDGNCEGGTATCTAKAICKYCETEYGDIDSTNHTGGTEIRGAKSATCTEEGYTGDVYCKSCEVKLSTGSSINKLPHDLVNTPAKDATVIETGNDEYWQCTVCDKYFSDAAGTNEIKLDDTVISKLPPEIIKGMDQSVTEGEKKALSFTSNAAYSDFIRVELDGSELSEENYEKAEGSIIITLDADYVATLPAGEHTIGIVSESGTAETTFTVEEKAVSGTSDDSDNDSKADAEDSAKTGDDTNLALWIALMLLAGAGITGTTIYTRRKRTNE